MTTYYHWTMTVERVMTDPDGVQWLFNDHPTSGHDIVAFGLRPVECTVRPGDVILFESTPGNPAYVTINGGPHIEIRPYLKAPYKGGLPLVGDAFVGEKGGTAG